MTEDQGPADISSEYAVSLTKHLISLYRTNTLADISVTCADENFDLHSPVLSHASGYFRSILKDNTDGDGDGDGDNSPILNLDFIPPITPPIFRIIADSLYTGIVHGIDESNVTDILEGSHHLDVPHAKDACVAFMLRHLDIDNCLQYWLSAQLCENTKVKNEAIGLVGRHLDEVSKTSTFLGLQSNTVMEILGDDKLQVSSEVEVYEAAISWLKYDVDGRVGELSGMLDSIRLDLLPVKYLVDVVGKEDMIEENSSAMSKYSKALKCKLGGERSSSMKARHNVMHGMRGGYEKLSKSMRFKTRDAIIDGGNEDVFFDSNDKLEVGGNKNPNVEAISTVDDSSHIVGTEEFLPEEAKQRPFIAISQGPLFQCCSPRGGSRSTDSEPSDIKVTLDKFADNVKGTISNASRSIKEVKDKLLERKSLRKQNKEEDDIGDDDTHDSSDAVITALEGRNGADESDHNSNDEVEAEDTGEGADSLENEKKIVDVEEGLSLAPSIPTPTNDMDGLSLSTETFEHVRSTSKDLLGDDDADGNDDESDCCA